MSIVDTHTHLYEKIFSHDIDDVIKRAIKNGVKKFFIPCTHRLNLHNMFSLEKKYIDICKIMIGIHPIMVDNNVNKELLLLEKYLDIHVFSAIGEIGIDLVSEKQKYFINEQLFAFKEQVNWAKRLSLPIIIHSRGGLNEILNILKVCYKGEKISGIFHCFSGSLEDANKIIKLGLKLGIGGLITYKNCKIKSFIKNIELKHIVLETDSPYLSPYPLIGKRNEPSNIIVILDMLSKVYNISKEKIAEITTKNAKNIFKF